MSQKNQNTTPLPSPTRHPGQTLARVFRTFVFLCCVAIALAGFFVVQKVLFPASTAPYLYFRQRASYAGQRDILQIQNIGGSKSEQTIASFAGQNGDLLVFGNTQSSDYDFDAPGGYLAILDKDLGTKDFVSLGAYGIANIVQVLLVQNYYFVLHDDGDKGEVVSITKIPTDLSKINEPVAIQSIRPNNKKALQLFYNDDLSAPKLFAVVSTNPFESSKQNLLVASFNLDLVKLAETSMVDGAYSLDFLTAYPSGYDGNTLTLFANKYSPTQNYKYATEYTITLGASAQEKKLDLSLVDYQSLAITPTHTGGFLLACMATDGSKSGLFFLIEVSAQGQVNHTYDQNQLFYHPTSVKFLPSNRGVFLFVATKETGGLYFGQGLQSIFEGEVLAMRGTQTIDDLRYVDYASNQLLLVGTQKFNAFVAYLVGEQVLYKQTFGGSRQECNPHLLLPPSGKAPSP
ncbi:MAG: hypothetical protein FWD76_01730, partial [Firmicutes bacterium]|nr:hypothetical protein [Bacillota bacterium]